MSSLGDHANKHWAKRMHFPADEVRYLWQPFADLTLDEQEGELEGRLQFSEIDSPDTKRTAIQLYNYEHFKDFMIELNAVCPAKITGWAMYRLKAHQVSGTIADIINDMSGILDCYPVVLEGKTPGHTTICAFDPKSKTKPACFVEFTDLDPAGAFINPYGDNGK